MIYLKKFETTAQYESYITGDTNVLPNVSICDDQPSVVHYNPYVEEQPNNEIWYTSTDGNIVDIPDLSALGGTYVGPEMISNTYENGKGVMKFAEDITWMGFDLSAGLGYGIIFINSEQLGGTCPKIKTISLPDSVTELKSEYISGVGTVTTFSGNYNLEEVSLSNCITEIGNNAFINCSSLISITIPEGVTSIGINAFHNCRCLTSITIPESVTSIGEYAFEGCSGLTSITIPESVTSIGQYAFQNCSGLTSIAIPEGVTSIEDWTFNSCCSLTSITIPEGVTRIGQYAFNNCSSLTSITIPEGVTSIGSCAFQYCSSLTSITIPYSVTRIGDMALQDCSNLTSITIPEGVTSIGGAAFANCSSLASIIFNGTISQWNGITKGMYWNGSVPATYVQCTDGQVQL